MNNALELFETGEGRFQPDLKFMYADGRQYVLDQQFLAFLVGTVALGLPFVMLFAAAAGTCFYYSISHFYYAKFFGDVLVAALVFIGTFLISYRGENSAESKLATVAGICAYGIAVFPTAGRGCEDLGYSGRLMASFTADTPKGPVTVVPADDPGGFFELFSNVGVLHFASAALLFSFFAFYTFFVFTRVIKDEHLDQKGVLTPVKKTRNGLYIGCGIVIVLSMAAMALHALIGGSWEWWDENNATFWCEALSLWAFGLSWMVKGRFYGWALLDPRDRA